MVGVRGREGVKVYTPEPMAAAKALKSSLTSWILSTCLRSCSCGVNMEHASSKTVVKKENSDLSICFGRPMHYEGYDVISQSGIK